MVEGQTPQIEAGVVAAVGQSSSGYVIGVIESGTADGIVAVDFTSTAANRRAGIVLRMEDGNNFLLLQYSGNWSAGRVDLLQRVHGVFSILTGVSVGPLDPPSQSYGGQAGTHRLEARIVGGSITGLLDGFALFETTANNNSWGTRHGLLWLRSIDTTTTYDNFAVTTQILPPLLPWNATYEASLNRFVIPAEGGTNTVTVDVTMPHRGMARASSPAIPGTLLAKLNDVGLRDKVSPLVGIEYAFSRGKTRGLDKFSCRARGSVGHA